MTDLQTTTGDLYPSASSLDLEADESAAVHPSGCSGKPPMLSYVLGALSYDLKSEATRDSLVQQGVTRPEDPQQLLAHLEAQPWVADSVTWTVLQDTTPIYAVLGAGPFGHEVYSRLAELLRRQGEGEIEMVALAGYSGGSVELMSGQSVPALLPDRRGMSGWSLRSLTEAAAGSAPAGELEGSVANFLQRLLWEVRNLGTEPSDRALNFAATHALSAGEVFRKALTAGYQLDGFEVEESPVCRPGSSCWDVTLTFFDPENRTERSRHVYRYSIDVSAVMPVTVGPVRHWDVY